MENIMVSVICNTYNHEDYIRDALESFVGQKTDFAYEVLIHDDASTDKTRQIIQEFEKKYPEIIKPIYQTENQWSKDISITITYQYPRVKGKYIALCEGDDYWTDPYKLQKQVNALEANKNVDICAHATSLVNGKTHQKICTIAPAKRNVVIPIERVIIGGGGFVATNSLMYRSSLTVNMPEFIRTFHIDYALQIYGALRNGMLYLKDNMSVYRYMVPGSWSSKFKRDETFTRIYDKKFDNLRRLFNEETKEQYVRYFDFAELISGQECKKVITKEYRDIFRMLPFKRRCKTIIRAYIPIVQKIKRSLKRP